MTALQVTLGSDVTEDRPASDLVTGETVLPSGQIDHDLTLSSALTVTPALTVLHIPSPTFSVSWRYFVLQDKCCDDQIWRLVVAF